MIIFDAAAAFVAIIDAAIAWARALAAAAAFTLCVIAYAVGPLIAPTARSARRRIRPAWARGRARARRIALDAIGDTR